MRRDEYGRGPVLQAVDKAVAFINWYWVAQVVAFVSVALIVRILAHSGMELWEQVLGLFSMMSVAAAAYIVGTHDGGSARELDGARRESELLTRYWDADFNEITRDEAIQRNEDGR